MFRVEMRSDQVRTGRQRVEQGRDDPLGLVLVFKKVQDAHEHERDRLREVEHLPDDRRRQDLARRPQVGVDVGGAALLRGGEQRPRVRED
jgi:hypothetical protein